MTVALVGGITLLASPSAFAESKIKEEKVMPKTLTGYVSGVGPRFIAVEYPQDAAKGIGREMALPVAEKAQLQGVKALKDFQLGDRVTVEYQETAFKDDTEDVLKSKRVATKITLVKAAPPQKPAPDTEAP